MGCLGAGLPRRSTPVANVNGTDDMADSQRGPEALDLPYPAGSHIGTLVAKDAVLTAHRGKWRQEPRRWSSQAWSCSAEVAATATIGRSWRICCVAPTGKSRSKPPRTFSWLRDAGPQTATLPPADAHAQSQRLMLSTAPDATPGYARPGVGVQG